MSARTHPRLDSRAGGLRATGMALVHVLALGLLAACGPPSDFRGVPAPQQAVPGTAGRECYYANAPDATPSFTRLTRPGTLGNVALWGRGLDPSDSVELSVRWADDGKLLWVEVIRSTLPLETVEPLASLLLESMVDSARADWGVRVWMAGGDIAATAPSVICPPRPREFSTRIPRVTDQRTLQGLIRLRGRRFPLEIRIDEYGSPMGVKLVRPTGSYAVDQYILEYAWRTSFWPKLHDGIAIPSTLMIEIEIPRR